MNFRLILNIIGIALVIISWFMVLPIIVSLIYKQHDIIPLTVSFVITFVAGGGIYLITKKHEKEEISHRDAFIIVTLTWIIISLFGSMPYMLTGTLHAFTDAFFESMAGFTTTGASVIADVKLFPKDFYSGGA